MKPHIEQGSKTPFLYIAVCFILGVVLNRLFPGIGLIYVLSVCALFLILSTFEWIFNWNALKQIRIFSLLLTFSIVFAGYGYDKCCQSLLFKDKLPLEGIYSGIIEQKTLAANNSQKYTILVDGFKQDNAYSKASEKILLQCNDSLLNESLIPGNRVLFQCQLKEIINRGNPSEFDYRKFMLSQGIRYQCYVNSRT